MGTVNFDACLRDLLWGLKFVVVVLFVTVTTVQWKAAVSLD